MDFSFKNRDKLDFLFSKRISSLCDLKEKVFLLNQKHTDEIYIIKEKKDTEIRPVADSVITHLKEIAVGVKTADCVPALIFDTENLVIAAVHSGWSGTAKKIIVKTIEKMKEIYNSNLSDIIIMLGPSICGRCYSVTNEVINEFKKILKYDFYLKKEDRYYIDLKDINKNLLIEKGIKKENIFIHPDCTYCKNDEYQSFRYHKNTLNFQISYIKLL